MGAEREEEVRTDAQEDASLVLHEEHLKVGTRPAERTVRARKRVETVHVAEDVPVQREEVAVERVPAAEDDSGEVLTLEDGSISVPLKEEELVVTKRVVTRERLIIRKRTGSEQRRVEADLEREVLDVEGESEAARDAA